LGFQFIVVTNQSAVGWGLISERDVDRFNQRLIHELTKSDIEIKIEHIYVCPHDPVFGIGQYKRECDCRKPRPGMFHTAAAEHRLELSECYYIGDKMSDVVAGFNAGCKTILVETGVLDDVNKYPRVSPDIRVKNLAKAARVIAGEVALERMCATEESIVPFSREIRELLKDRETEISDFVYRKDQVSNWQR
jgi:D-glycero-D-manno-heptose 1,7-bisphosphate phosphatase